MHHDVMSPHDAESERRVERKAAGGGRGGGRKRTEEGWGAGHEPGWV